VRFRLKRLVPFDADDAAVSYQVMATQKGLVRVMAVAMPREVLAEYESVVQEAGFEPGAVLPSTLAALAGLGERDAPVLMVNAGRSGVTTAIVKDGVLLLHRSVDLDLSADRLEGRAVAAGDPAGSPKRSGGDPTEAAAGVQTAVLEQEMRTERALAGASAEIAQAVSVAAAYFEDSLGAAPGAVLSAGTLGAEALAGILGDAGVGPIPVRELVDGSMLGPGVGPAAGPGGVPRGWLAGVRGALTS
jgi:type IV pilus assembly protein PilM